VEQQRDAPWLPQEQQSTILNVTVAAQHPQYAMTALALGDRQIWVNRLDRPQGESARIRIQASDVSLVLQPAQQTSIRNILPAQVMQCIESHGQVEVRLEISGRTCGRASAPGLAMSWGDPGQRLYAQIKSVSIAA
jgi:molybdate transport system ATP-binding protein